MLPELIEKSAEPRCPTNPLNPGKLVKAAAVLAPAASTKDDVPIVLPFESRAKKDVRLR